MDWILTVFLIIFIVLTGVALILAIYFFRELSAHEEILRKRAEEGYRTVGH